MQALRIGASIAGALTVIMTMGCVTTRHLSLDRLPELAPDQPVVVILKGGDERGFARAREVHRHLIAWPNARQSGDSVLVPLDMIAELRQEGVEVPTKTLAVIGGLLILLGLVALILSGADDFYRGAM